MAESKPQTLSPEGGSCHDSFNTASDNSQEETVCTIKKKENWGLEEEQCIVREGDINEQMIKDKSPEDSHSSGVEKQRTSSIDNESGTSVNSCDTAGTDSMNTVDVSKSTEDTSRTKTNDSKSSSVNDSKGAKVGVGNGIGQRLHQGTAASRARQGKKVRWCLCQIARSLGLF